MGNLVLYFSEDQAKDRSKDKDSYGLRDFNFLIAEGSNEPHSLMGVEYRGTPYKIRQLKEYDLMDDVISRIETEGIPYLEESALVKSLMINGSYNSDVAKAVSQARKSHGNQQRDIGGSYLTQHIYPIANNSNAYFIEKGGVSEQLNHLTLTALLHDSVEDDPNFSFEDIEQLFEGDLGRTISSSVEVLTKPSIEPSWQNFTGKDKFEKKASLENYMLEKIDSSYDNSIYVVRAFDRINNIQCLPVPSLEKTEDLCRRTQDIFEPWLRGKDPDLADLLYLKRMDVERLF